jgi:DNA-binding NarL/FixJ family response regulator
VIADDQDLIRGGLRAILNAENDIEVVAEVADGASAASAAVVWEADVVLMDIEMPNVDGITGTREVLRRRPQCRVVVLTMFDLDEYVFGALRAGASGFLLKTTPPAELAKAVRVCHHGDTLYGPTVTRRMVETYIRRRPTAGGVPPEVAHLTARELDVLQAIARGLSNAEIAAELYLGEATVKTHVAKLFAKLGLRDRIQAVVLAYETGLVTPGEREV